MRRMLGRVCDYVSLAGRRLFASQWDVSDYLMYSLNILKKQCACNHSSFVCMFMFSFLFMFY